MALGVDDAVAALEFGVEVPPEAACADGGHRHQGKQCQENPFDNAAILHLCPPGCPAAVISGCYGAGSSLILIFLK